MKIQTLIVETTDQKDRVVYIKHIAKGRMIVHESYYYNNPYNDHASQISEDDFNSKIASWIIEGREVKRNENSFALSEH